MFGHLHIPLTDWHDGVAHQEVSLGYPREWERRRRGPLPADVLRHVQITPPAAHEASGPVAETRG